MNGTPFVAVMRATAILLWILALYLMLAMGIWLLFGLILTLHILEVVLWGCKKGIEAGYSRIYSIIMTLILGFTWWMYLDDKV